ncbi:hypothetical protein LZ31DRAFT_562767 [Colletotrichum somersetense]|nr:hypothetical protein LZ31DRAFT_562767 [Colletotrichum somersetense]
MSATFAADQACKECRSRKAKCGWALPTCNLCVKYRRHCLYEKHARTPLTRKHLTEVEERLERAKALITHMRALMPAHAGSASSLASYSNLNHEQTRAHRTTRHHRQPDEQDTLTNYLASPEATLEVDTNGDSGDSGADPIADGMASLAVNEKESGYLGVASGAALLRLLEPSTPKSRAHSSFSRTGPINLTQSPLTTQLDPNRHITDAMVDAYFRSYNVSYPIIHEATFRAQYAGVIPRPCARSILSFNFLEVGNLTLVQALTLISNYQQKRDKPNSGYNYLGLAVRMAMSLGLHKEFQGWNISPLNVKIRRRVWWSLCVFDVGASITFSRPSIWPYGGVEVSLPLNFDDKSLTAISKSYPPETQDITPYTAVRTQANFHIATTPIYTRVISKPLPTSSEMLKLDQELLEPNLRVIMYRPFVIRQALQARDRRLDDSPDNVQAFEKCLADAKATITSISEFWERNEKNRLSAWYALYLLFQAALIPCICLRNDPNSSNAADWREQVTITIRCIVALAPVNSSSPRCYQVIMDLCGRFLNDDAVAACVLVTHPQMQTTTTPGYEPDTIPIGTPEPIDECPQTQINSAFSMMWPNVPPMEAADVVMADDAWMEFLRSGTSGDGDGV